MALVANRGGGRENAENDFDRSGSAALRGRIGYSVNIGQAVASDLRKVGLALVVLSALGFLLQEFVPIEVSLTGALLGAVLWVGGLLILARNPGIPKE